MLQKFIQFGLKLNFFKITLISAFKNSSKEGISNVHVEAINFDDATKIYCAMNGLKKSPKSCDALKPLIKLNEIHLIEFKQIASSRKDVEDLVKNKFSLVAKLQDSMQTIETMRDDPKFNCLNKNDLNQTHIRYILAFGGPGMNHKGNANYLSLLLMNEIRAAIEGVFSSSLLPDYPNKTIPELKKTSQLQSYYENLNQVKISCPPSSA